MIDEDGVQRPNSPDGHMYELKNAEEIKLKTFDGEYAYYPKLPFRIWAAFLRDVGILVMAPAMLFKFGCHVYGKQNRKAMRRKGCVMTLNHVHVWDDFTVGSNVFFWRKIYYTTLDANIRLRTVGFFMRSIGGIPIPAESLSGMKKFNEDIGTILKKNKPVLFNPEAALWPEYRGIRPFKKGAFSAAVKNNVPVLPIVLLFKRKLKHNGRFKVKFSYAICKPIYPDQSLPLHQRIDALTQQVYEVSKQVAQEWYSLQNCGYEDQENLPKLRAKDLIFENDHFVVRKKR